MKNNKSPHCTIPSGPYGFILASLLTVFVSTAVAQESSTKGVEVIVNKNSTIIPISEKEVKDIFLGRKRKWSNGEKIKVGILQDGKLHAEFLGTFIDKSTMQFKRHWRKAVFSGKGTMPHVFHSEEELLDFIRHETYSIGYISPVTKTNDMTKSILKKELK